MFVFNVKYRPDTCACVPVQVRFFNSNVSGSVGTFYGPQRGW